MNVPFTSEEISLLVINSHQMKKFNCLVIFSFDNCGDTVSLFQSDAPITLEHVVAHVEKTEGPINWDRNGVTLLGPINEIETMII